MKNILTRLLLSMLVFAMASACSDDFLEKEPLGRVTEDAYFLTSDQAVESVNAAYNILRRWEVHVFAYVGMTDLVSDDADKGSTPTDYGVGWLLSGDSPHQCGDYARPGD